MFVVIIFLILGLSPAERAELEKMDIEQIKQMFPFEVKGRIKGAMVTNMYFDSGFVIIRLDSMQDLPFWMEIKIPLDRFPSY